MDNLIIISSRYPHKGDSTSGVFVHAQVNELKKYFKKVVVICIIPNIPKALSKKLGSKRESDHLAEDYSFDNVDVFFVRYSLMPTLGVRHAWVLVASSTPVPSSHMTPVSVIM